MRTRTPHPDARAARLGTRQRTLRTPGFASEGGTSEPRSVESPAPRAQRKTIRRLGGRTQAGAPLRKADGASATGTVPKHERPTRAARSPARGLKRPTDRRQSSVDRQRERRGFPDARAPGQELLCLLLPPSLRQSSRESRDKRLGDLAGKLAVNGERESTYRPPPQNGPGASPGIPRARLRRPRCGAPYGRRRRTCSPRTSPTRSSRSSPAIQGLGISKVADLIAIRLALAALDGREGKWLDAVQQIRQLEGPTAPSAPDLPVPELPEDPDRLREVADALREAGVLD